MAWTDDRLWCHPKYVGLSWRAKAVLRHAFEYAGGMGTKGILTQASQQTIGSTSAVRAELVAAGWWDENGDGRTVHIHDWEEHNGLRDEKRQRDRERKRQARREGRWNETDRPRTGRAPKPPQTTDGAHPGAG